MMPEGQATKERLVPLSFIRGVFEQGSLPRAELIYDRKENNYRLKVDIGEQYLMVARRDGDVPRTWRGIERAVSFIRDNLGHIPEIVLIYPSEDEQ